MLYLDIRDIYQKSYKMIDHLNMLYKQYALTLA
ncbi:hypothetical protein AA637_14880 [Cyanobacterium sp. HL-69]|nr:hypothetical protein AA637_14880 [Cyanobacterium sp. HL-69]